MPKKIAFYLPTNKHDVDCSNIESGNPGLGGSEYLIILTSTLLSKSSDDVEICLYTNFKGQLPDCLTSVYCNGFADFAEKCRQNNVYYIVANYTSIKRNVLVEYEDLKFIIWCHNFVSWADLDLFSRQKNVVRIVCVGREQLDLYRDHQAFVKSDFIYNTLCLDELKGYSKKCIPTSQRNHNVLYIGSLIECKGFLHLAKCWKKVLKKVPDANLYVIGKGNLYDESASLGKFGLAESRFEEQFMSELSENGEILPSVHFLGILGEEKFDVIAQTKVGVPNPGGVTETFGLTAVEMQALGCHVTSIKCPGYLDTVVDKSCLYSSVSKLADYIVGLLLSYKDVDVNEIFQYFERFSNKDVIQQWQKLFDIAEESEVYLHKDRYVLRNECYHYKNLKEKIRLLKSKKHFLEALPSLEQLLYKNH